MGPKKSTQNEKMLKGARKRGSKIVSERDINLRQQYDLIRDDILKLKEDLQKGYSMAKVAVEKKKIFDQILKLK